MPGRSRADPRFRSVEAERRADAREGVARPHGHWWLAPIVLLISYQLYPGRLPVGVGSPVFGGGRGLVWQRERRQARNALEARGIACKRVP